MLYQKISLMLLLVSLSQLLANHAQLTTSTSQVHWHLKSWLLNMITHWFDEHLFPGPFKHNDIELILNVIVNPSSTPLNGNSNLCFSVWLCLYKLHFGEVKCQFFNYWNQQGLMKSCEILWNLGVLATPAIWRFYTRHHSENVAGGCWWTEDHKADAQRSHSGMHTQPLESRVGIPQDGCMHHSTLTALTCCNLQHNNSYTSISLI